MASKRKTKKAAKRIAKKSVKKGPKKGAKKSARKNKAPVSRTTRPAPVAPGKQLTDSRFTLAFVDEFLGPSVTCKWMANQEAAAYLNDFAALVEVLIGSAFPHGSAVGVKDTPAAHRLRQLIQAEGWPSGSPAETLSDILLCIGRLLHCLVVLNGYGWPPRHFERWPPHT